MRKLIALFIIGIIGLIAFLSIKKALTGDGAISLVCKTANDTITVKFDPTSEKAISATHKDGTDFEMKDVDERIKKIGLLRYIDEFTRDFEEKKGGACFKKQIRR